MEILRIPAHHSVRSLKAAFAWLGEGPERRVQVDRYGEEPMDREAFSRWFRDCLFRKIYQHEKPRGRKDCADWYWAAWRTAREVNTPRLRVRYVPIEFRRRLRHRIATDEG